MGDARKGRLFFGIPYTLLLVCCIWLPDPRQSWRHGKPSLNHCHDSEWIIVFTIEIPAWPELSWACLSSTTVIDFRSCPMCFWSAIRVLPSKSICISYSLIATLALSIRLLPSWLSLFGKSFPLWLYHSSCNHSSLVLLLPLCLGHFLLAPGAALLALFPAYFGA